MHCRQVIKYNTHLSFNRLYGETFIVYNPLYEKLTINESYTIQASGTKIVTPNNAFNEVLPRFAADAPDHNQLREMVVTHTGLEIGATAYLDYTLHTKAGYEPELDKCLLLQEASPVKEYKVSVTVPDNKKLSYQLHLAKGSPQTSTKDGATHYQWTFRNTAASSKELYQPSDNRNAPYLVFSTWESQRAAMQWLAAQIKPGNTDELKALLKKTEQHDSNPYLPVARAYDFVVNQIAYTPVPAAYAGYQLRNASQVLHSAYGTAGEKAALLLAVTKVYGMSADAVAVYPSFLDGSVGSLNAIIDFVVLVSEQGQDFLLSPVNFTPYSLAWSKPAYRYVTISSNARVITANAGSSATLSMNIEAGKEKVGTKSNVTLVGAFNPLLPVWLNQNKAKNQLTGGTTNEVAPGMTVNERELSATLNGELPVKANNDYYTIQLPEVAGGANSWGMQYLSTARRTNLEIPFQTKESYTYTIHAPQGLEAINQSKALNIENKVGKVSIICEKQSSGQWKLTRLLELNRTIIAPTEYAAFIELMKLWQNENYRKVVFH